MTLLQKGPGEHSQQMGTIGIRGSGETGNSITIQYCRGTCFTT